MATSLTLARKTEPSSTAASHLKKTSKLLEILKKMDPVNPRNIKSIWYGLGSSSVMSIPVGQMSARGVHDVICLKTCVCCSV